MSSFPAYPKTPRFSMGCLITEKIDGTNALISITQDEELSGPLDWCVRAGSRKRWLTLEKDNFGFARWVDENEEQLIELLGVGTHYGEWYGSGIQRRYGLDHKRLALFDGPGRYPWAVDVDQLRENESPPDMLPTKDIDLGDAKLGVTSLLYKGGLDLVLPVLIEPQDAKTWFLPGGSVTVPGYEHTEGLIVHLQGSSGGQRFKVVWDKR